MRIAIVSDIHGNRTAFEAVLADLGKASPDLIFHGGALADFGASPAAIIDQIRDLGWPGVAGNGEEALAIPETLEEFAGQSSLPPSIWNMIREMMAATRSMLGEDRIDWLRGLPRVQIQEPVAVVHASPESTWRSPGIAASDAELETVYGPLGQSIAGPHTSCWTGLSRRSGAWNTRWKTRSVPFRRPVCHIPIGLRKYFEASPQMP